MYIFDKDRSNGVHQSSFRADTKWQPLTNLSFIYTHRSNMSAICWTILLEPFFAIGAACTGAEPRRLWEGTSGNGALQIFWVERMELPI